MIVGKIIGALVGLRFGGPLGALAGGILGHFVDQWLASQSWIPSTPWSRTGSQEVFTECVVALAAKLAKCDGAVSRAEVDAFKAQFHIPRERTAAVGALYNRAKTSAEGYETYARRLAQTFADAPVLLAAVYDALLRVALVDGALHPAERAFLDTVAGIFAQSAQGYGGFAHGTPREPAGGDPYAVLGVARDAPTEEIKAAWRRLTREHHPDTLTAKGLSQDYVAMATRKMAEINAAWDRIRAERGEA